MILYRLAKWMEERKRLKRLIAEADGNSAVYIEQKALVEQQMIREAYQWLEPGKAGAEPPVVLHVLDEWGGVQPLFGMDEADRMPGVTMQDVLVNMQRNSIASDAEPVARVPEELYRMPLIGEEALHAQL
ncbi:MAG: hypothetical protein K0R28_4325 [Paenibacillus sp.]|jgi:hypothetical protein|nr:hypothetical protein [Paenibacillus sp.]